VRGLDGGDRKAEASPIALRVGAGDVGADSNVGDRGGGGSIATVAFAATAWARTVLPSVATAVRISWNRLSIFHAELMARSAAGCLITPAAFVPTHETPPTTSDTPRATPGTASALERAAAEEADAEAVTAAAAWPFVRARTCVFVAACASAQRV
jgi:hypothetical protein